jgi:hypothetical protein
MNLKANSVYPKDGMDTSGVHGVKLKFHIKVWDYNKIPICLPVIVSKIKVKVCQL